MDSEETTSRTSRAIVKLANKIKKMPSPPDEIILEKWKKDEDGFFDHFQILYDDFVKLVNALNENQQEKYEKIRQVHEEAAILWAIHEGKSHGLLKEI